MDYGALDKNIVKDKFLVPLIDYLLDEPFRAKYFFKLDLKSGYHQIRVVENNIHKISMKVIMSSW